MSSSKNKWNLRSGVITFIFLIAVLDVILAADVKVECTNIDKYYFAKPTSYCTAYYKCTNQGKYEIEECDPGSIFDFYSQTCTRNAGVCYEPICTGRTNGVYADTTHGCWRSFTCHSGRLISVDNCPPSHLHNGYECVNQDLVMCELPRTTAIGYPFSGDQRCVGHSDGSYGVDNCNKYVICRDQVVVDVKTCPDGYRFKNEIHLCIPANQVPKCSDDYDLGSKTCTEKLDGHHFNPMSTDCLSYIICKDGKLVSKEKCAGGTIFNGEMCVPSPLFTCPSAIWNKNDICKNKDNGFFINPIHGCSSYVRCMSQRTVQVNYCPYEQYFDPDERNCIYEKFVERRKCKPPQRSFECDNKSQGFYQGVDCQTFFYCLNGFKTEYKCGEGNVFDGENCVPKDSYSCPNLDSNSCYSKSNGYYANHDESCRSYYYCSNGNKIIYLCDEGKVFNGTMCIPGIECNSNKICAGKSDGYHPDLRSNCRKYVYCVNGQDVHVLRCSSNKVFNGEKCVSPNLYACPSRPNYKTQNCVPKKSTNVCQTDGLFMDIESGCKNYYSCIKGKRSFSSCSCDKLFNGDLCVAQDKFTCPIYCEDSSMKNSKYPLSGY